MIYINCVKAKFKFVTGHVKSGMLKFSKDTIIIKIFQNGTILNLFITVDH